MLKNCWECVMGTRLDNEVYGTVLNGRAQSTAWPESQRQNEIMFRLPRPLNDGDIIEINGTLQENPEKLLVNLTTGQSNPDYQNIACRVEASFIDNYVSISGNINGEIDNDGEPSYEPNLLGQFPDMKFSFIIKVRLSRESSYLDIDVWQSNLGTRRLQHNVKDITFLILEGDIRNIEELIFKYEKLTTL